MKNQFNINNFLTEEEIARINATITEAEKTTAGEIKVLVVNKSSRLNLTLKKARRMFVWRRAKKEFYELGLQNTCNHTGILLMISLKERMVVVKGGTAIDGKIFQDTWDCIRDAVLIGLEMNRNAGGVIAAIKQMGKILEEHFPIKPGDTNEISDEIVFKD